MPRGVYERKPKTTEDTMANTEPTDETKEAAPEVEPEAEGELCTACWPEGWQGDQDAGECSHGTWTR